VGVVDRKIKQTQELQLFPKPRRIKELRENRKKLNLREFLRKNK